MILYTISGEIAKAGRALSGHHDLLRSCPYI